MLNINKVSKIGFGTWGLSGDAYGSISKRKAKLLLDYAFKKKFIFMIQLQVMDLGKLK